jgi:urease accessory protein
MSDRARQSQIAAASSSELARARALLQVWLSPSFPIGGFAYSHGIEKAVENGWIVNRDTLEAWIADLIERGSLRNDLIFLAASWRASAVDDGIAAIAELACAMQPSAERHLEATQQGRSFITQIEAAWPADAAAWAHAASNQTPTLPVAFGFAAASHDIPLADALNAFAIAFAANLTSAAIRLAVVGQTDAQRILAALMDRLLSAATCALTSTLDDLGGAAWRSDIASMQHETQYTRLFRS